VTPGGVLYQDICCSTTLVGVLWPAITCSWEACGQGGMTVEQHGQEEARRARLTGATT